MIPEAANPRPRFLQYCQHLQRYVFLLGHLKRIGRSMPIAGFVDGINAKLVSNLALVFSNISRWLISTRKPEATISSAIGWVAKFKEEPPVQEDGWKDTYFLTAGTNHFVVSSMDVAVDLVHRQPWKGTLMATSINPKQVAVAEGGVAKMVANLSGGMERD